MKDLGFVVTFRGNEGYIKLDHPDLIFELLVPERGRGIDKPYPLPKLGMNATALRFLNFLTMNIIEVKVKDVVIKLPHPVNFALHKLIIFQRRLKEEKAEKDRNTAIQILKALITKSDNRILNHTFRAINPKWQKKIINGLDATRENDIIKILTG